MRRILEVGPLGRPMHHREGDIKGDLQLNTEEEYIGIDQPHVVEAMSDNAVWRSAKERYGDRACLIEGDRADMSGIADGSIDELVALGTHAREGRVISEFRRVLAPGGILRLGVTRSGLQYLISTWGMRLKRLGFYELTSEMQEYKYRPRLDIPESEIDYVVVTFRKGGIHKAKV